MIEIYWTKNKDLHRKTELLITRRLGANFKILRTSNGKPYIDGNPLYFSLSHSRDLAVIAICDAPVGIDTEFCDNEKNFSHILSRFSEREKSFIDGAYCRFFINWVIKEAYIKMNGGTLARDLKRLEYYGDKLYCDGEEVTCNYAAVAHRKAGIYAVCAPTPELLSVKMKLFRLRKGETI